MLVSSLQLAHTVILVCPAIKFVILLDTNKSWLVVCIEGVG